jgi:hypothetical protein
MTQSLFVEKKLGKIMNPPNPFTMDVRVFPAEGVKSLVWQNGKLMDWVSGNVEYELNGIKDEKQITVVTLSPYLRAQ